MLLDQAGGAALVDHERLWLWVPAHGRDDNAASSFSLARSPLHSITSSARASSVVGTSRARAFAVLRLMARARPTLPRICGCHRHWRRPSGRRSAGCGHRSSPIAAAPAGTSRGGPLRRYHLRSRPPSTPMRRMRPGCCARDASGRLAATPPRAKMNSRLLIRSPRRRGRGGRAEFQARVPSRS
jgi:hypothetical protein